MTREICSSLPPSYYAHHHLFSIPAAVLDSGTMRTGLLCHLIFLFTLLQRDEGVKLFRDGNQLHKYQV